MKVGQRPEPQTESCVIPAKAAGLSTAWQRVTAWLGFVAGLETMFPLRRLLWFVPEPTLFQIMRLLPGEGSLTGMGIAQAATKQGAHSPFIHVATAWRSFY